MVQIFASQLHYKQKVYYKKYPFNLLFLYKLLHMRCVLRKYTVSSLYSKSLHHSTVTSKFEAVPRATAILEDDDGRRHRRRTTYDMAS